jgi:hypothetical protein
LLEGVDGIQEALSGSPQKSTRSTSLQLDIPQTTGVLFITSITAYKVQIVQALKPDDEPCRFQSAKYILSNDEVDAN